MCLCKLEIFLKLNNHKIPILEIQVVYSPPMMIWAKSCHSFFYLRNNKDVAPTKTQLRLGWLEFSGRHLPLSCCVRGPSYNPRLRKKEDKANGATLAQSPFTLLLRCYCLRRQHSSHVCTLLCTVLCSIS